MLERYSRREFSLWRLYWFGVLFFYLTPAVIAFMIAVLVVLFDINFPR